VCPQPQGSGGASFALWQRPAPCCCSWPCRYLQYCFPLLTQIVCTHARMSMHTLSHTHTHARTHTQYARTRNTQATGITGEEAAVGGEGAFFPGLLATKSPRTCFSPKRASSSTSYPDGFYVAHLTCYLFAYEKITHLSG